MKYLKLSLLALYAVLAMACAKQDDGSFEIKITGAEHFPEDARVSMYRYKTVEAPNPVERLKEAPFNGEFVYSGTVENAHTVVVDVLPADGAYPFHRVKFALEPGQTTIHFTGQKYFQLKGGKYNDVIVNSWNDDKDFKVAWKALLDFDGDHTDPEQRKIYSGLSAVVRDLKEAKLEEALNSTTDPLAKLLVYDTEYSGESFEQRNREIMTLCQQLDGYRQAALALKKVKSVIESRQAQSKITVGTVIRDFTAEDLSGQEFHLANVLENNKYVLVEFWSSWCGPCRAEIPHMKTAYKHFKSKGFEIVSFTLDSDRADWEDASEEEQIPWIDTGDLLAETSPVVKMYGVQAIPANYLVEGGTGKIVAMNLRQKALDDKLAELLGK